MLITLAACTGTKSDVTAVLERAESFLPASPDSAEVCLDSLGDGWTSLGSDGRALYGLLRTMTDAMQGRGIKSDSLIRPTYIYYKEQMEGKASVLQSEILKRRYARSALYFGRFLEDCDSIKHAEDLYREAITYSEQVEDWRTCYNASFSLGRSVSYSNQSEGCTILKQALSIYDRCNDAPLNKIYILRELSTNKIGTEQYDSALIYARIAFDVANQNQSEEYISEASRTLSQAYMYSGNCTEALYYAKLSVTDYSDATSYMLYNLANCYFACDSLTQSRQLYDVLSKDSDDHIRYVSYDMLSKIALRENDTQRACEYSDSAKQVLESMYYRTQQLKADYYDDIIEKEKQQYKLRVDNIESKVLFIVIIAIVAVIFICILSYFLYMKYVTKKNHEIELIEKNIEIEKQQSHLREQELINETNNKLLHQKSIRLALMQQQVFTELDNYKINLKDKGNLKMDEKSWEKMEKLLNMAEENFVHVLRKKYPRFNENDIRLCMMVKLKLTNSQIAEILCIGEEAVKKRKKKLKVSGFGITDTSVWLEKIIESM